MKKLLLAAVTISALSTSTALATESDFYGTIYGGVNKLNKASNLKSDVTGHIGLGAGYYINNTFRADLTLDHLFDPNFESKTKDNNNNGVKDKIKSEVNALMINGYADLIEAGYVQIFAGAGIGASRVKSSFSRTYDDSQLSASNYNLKAKENTNFAYALHVGITGEISHGIHAFLAYSWKDYGKTSKYSSANNTATLKASKFGGHHGTVGIRMDF